MCFSVCTENLKKNDFFEYLVNINKQNYNIFINMYRRITYYIFMIQLVPYLEVK